MGWFEARVLATTFSVAGISILSLICGAAVEARRWAMLGQIGLVANAITLLLTLLMIWDAVSLGDFDEIVACAYVVIIAIAHAALLANARLTRGQELVRTLTVIGIAALASIIIITILNPRDMSMAPQVIGVLGILVVCGTIAIPILHRVAAIHRTSESITTALELSLTCPRCSRTQTLPAGRSACVECKLRFVIQIEEEHCPRCGYLVYRIQSPNCPECGTTLPTGARG